MDRRFGSSCKKKESERAFSKRFVARITWFALLASPGIAQAQAILIEENQPQKSNAVLSGKSDEELPEVQVNSAPKIVEMKSEVTRSIPKGNLKNFFDRKDYVDLYQLRLQRRMGIGAEVLGRLGMIGADFEFNINERQSATAGIGAGPQYFSYSLGYKHLLDNRSLSPYFGVAVSRMISSRGTQITDTVPGWIGDYFLSAKDRSPEGFQKYFVSPQLGVQFTQFYGPSAGATVFLEIMAIYESESNRTAPAGALGMLYYL